MSAVSRRLERINSLLQSEVAQVIRELKDPGIGFVSVTRVECSPDLREARVRFSVMGPEQEKTATTKALERAGGFIRETLLRRLDLRRVPHLTFLIDENIEYGVHIASVIDKLNEGRDE